MSIPGANFSTSTTLTDGTQTLTFSNTVDVRTVPGGGWATWNSPPNVESSTPKVMAITTGITSFTITLSPPQLSFGIEIEPNNGTQPVTLTYLNGASTLGSVSRSVPGTAGALLFAASSSTPITSVVLTIPSGASGFALAQFRYGPNFLGAPTIVPTAVPTLSDGATAGLAIALLAVGVMLARRQTIDQA